MKIYNGTDLEYSVFAAIAAYDCAGALGNALTIIAVLWTPSLRGFTGILIINEQAACIMVELLSMFTYLSTEEIVGASARTISSSLLTSTRMATTLFLTLQNLNLYMAVCWSSSYKAMLTKYRARVAIVGTWIATGVFAPLTFFTDDFYVSGCTADILMMFCSRENAWIPAVLFVCGLLLPLICNFLCLWRVSIAAKIIPPNLTFGQTCERDRVLKKVKLIFASTILNSVFIAPLFIIYNLSQFFGGDSGAWRTVLMVLWSMSKIHQNLRLVVYFLCYRPIREATRAKVFRFMFCTVAPLNDPIPRPQQLPSIMPVFPSTSQGASSKKVYESPT